MKTNTLIGVENGADQGGIHSFNSVNLQRMQAFHTIVIGGGPGGLACATILAKNGVDVLLIERNRLIGPKTCAGGLTWSGLSLDIPDHLIERSFNRQYIYSILQKTVVTSSVPIISTIDRKRLGQWMLRQAEEAGTRVITGVQVRDIRNGHIITSDADYRYQYLVGADGSSSLVRRHLNLDTFAIGAGIHYQVAGEFPRMEWHLNTDLFRTGYAWIFPHKHYASVGVYACRRDANARKLLQNLHQWALKYGITLNQSRPRAALINFDYRGWRFGNKFLVGDAAGLASGLTGEGIYPAILSGETVAHTILDQQYESTKLNRLIQKHQKHTRILGLTPKNRLLCKVTMEALVAAIRSGLIHFSALEMAER